MNNQQMASSWALDLLNRDDWIILDTETTGMGRNAEIVQIATLDPGGTSAWDSYVKPTVPIEPGATAVHKITDDMVATAPTFDAILPELLKQVGCRDVIIYGAAFDLRLIQQSAHAVNIYLEFPYNQFHGCRVFNNGGLIQCLMLQYAQFCGEWNPKHEEYQWQKLPGADHTAPGDCRAALEVINTMAQSYAVTQF